MRHKLRAGFVGGLLTAAIVALSPPAAHADAGIPMLPVQYPQILLYIIPIIVIEAVYLRRHLNVKMRRTVIAVTTVNLVTVGLGYPLTWGMYKALDGVIGFPASPDPVFTRVWQLPMWVAVRLFPSWTGPAQGIWPVLAVYVLLLLPGFVLSGIVKSWLINWYDLLNFRGNTKMAVLVANRYSYFFLAVTGCVLLYLTLYRP